MKMTSYSETLQIARNAFSSGKTKNISFRKRQLKALLKMYDENESAFVKALSEDLRKPKQEAILSEINMLKDETSSILSQIDDWTKPQKISASLVTAFDKSVIYPDPYGVVLIMGAWNYPAQLTLLPVTGAIAAGNCVIVKPSEISPATAKLTAELMPKYLDHECYHVICGGVPETTELLKERFDYIFYTGSSVVGKIVRDAANKHLTPTTLELGGKSPVFIDDSVDMNMAVRRIMWGKCTNLGQTCVAPDYVLCSKSVQEKFIAKAKEILKEWYGDNAHESPDLCRIVNDRHFSRIVEYLKDGKIAVGGQHDASDKWIEPTILTNVLPESKIMTEEIFGPILPILIADSPKEAMEFINSREKPLALYVFSNNQKLIDIFMREVSFGGSCVNDVMLHLAVPGLPFGGVGNSGMGSYHGKASFDCFTHKKSCLIRNYSKIADVVASNRYPPYTPGKIKFLTLMLKDRQLPSMKVFSYVFAFFFGVLSFYVLQKIVHIEN